MDTVDSHRHGASQVCILYRPSFVFIEPHKNNYTVRIPHNVIAHRNENKTTLPYLLYLINFESILFHFGHFGRVTIHAAQHGH